MSDQWITSPGYWYGDGGTADIPVDLDSHAQTFVGIADEVDYVPASWSAQCWNGGAGYCSPEALADGRTQPISPTCHSAGSTYVCVMTPAGYAGTYRVVPSGWDAPVPSVAPSAFMSYAASGGGGPAPVNVVGTVAQAAHGIPEQMLPVGGGALGVGVLLWGAARAWAFFKGLGS